MANVMSPIGIGQTFFNTVGQVLAGGKINTYTAGTTTPATTYTDNTLGTPNANPIILNAAGQLNAVQIWWGSGNNFKFVITDANNVTLMTLDNLTGINDTGSVASTAGTPLLLTNAGGTVNAITATATGVLAYTAGQTFYFIPSGPNTGPVTLNLNSLGVKNVTQQGTQVLASGELLGGQEHFVTYDGTRFQLLNASAPSCAFFAYRAASPQGLLNNTNVTVLYDTKLFDTGTNLTLGTGVFSAPTTGIYFLTGTVAMSATTATPNYSLSLNTSVGAVTTKLNTSAVTAIPSLTVSGVFNLTAGGNGNLIVRQDSGANLATAIGQDSCNFSGFRLR